MVFVGYGFLMIFLKRYGFSGLGYNFIVGTVAIQWSVVMEGFFDLEDSKIKLTGDRWVYRKRFLHEGLKRGGRGAKTNALGGSILTTICGWLFE